MRITGGILRGRKINVPRKGVRPTQDKVRAALFSALAAKMAGAHVLDLFAGTGALGLEAWSRNAERVCWVERNRQVFAVLRRNVDQLCRGAGGQTQTVCGDALQVLEQGIVRGPFDLILADPPYDREGRCAWLQKALQVIEKGNMLATDGVIAYEMSAEETVPPLENWIVVRDKKYGGSRLLFFMKKRRET